MMLILCPSYIASICSKQPPPNHSGLDDWRGLLVCFWTKLTFALVLQGISQGGAF